MMYILFETMRVQNGIVCRLEAHQQRMMNSYFTLFGKPCRWLLSNELQLPHDGVERRVRFSYGEYHYKVELEPYFTKCIECVDVIEVQDIEYSLKYSNRLALDALVEQRKGGDDVLIVKQGLVTDTSTCNIVFWDGTNWYTPHSPLLKGTVRAWLLQEGVIRERKIGIDEVRRTYIGYRLINALRDWDTPMYAIDSLLNLP